MNMKLLLGLGMGLCLLAGTAGAQSVYRCRDTGGAVVYQSAACSGTTEKQWSAAPALRSGAAVAMDRQSAERSIERDRQHLKASRRAGAVRNARRTGKRVARNAPNSCERARLARAAAHERRGVRWSFDDASAWDAKVFKACWQ